MSDLGFDASKLVEPGVVLVPDWRPDPGSDLRVGRIGYGAMRLTGPDLWGSRDIGGAWCTRAA